MRFDHTNVDDNVSGHQQATEMIQRLDSCTAVIFGGDFNMPKGRRGTSKDWDAVVA